MNQIHEECGVFGVYSPKKEDLASYAYAGLSALQHRGQEAAGIAVNEDRVIRYHKDTGLVNEVFTPPVMKQLGEGTICVGHVRYSTSGSNTALNAQPMVVKHVKGQLALCHNGNLTNSYVLRNALELQGCIFQTTSDTEVISYIITRNRLKAASIEEAVERSMSELEGSYSLVLMSPTKLIACRDPLGLRPLCYGETPDHKLVFASETCALDAVGARLIRDVLPGEIIIVDGNGLHTITTHVGKCKPKLCVFEYIYFSRADSVIEGVQVHEARRLAGKYLAEDSPVDADVVIGVPDSGLDAALGYAEASGIPYDLGLIKNKYIGRTFIAPVQTQREALVHLKLNPVPSVLSGKKVIVIDDSIVRGTTSERIIRLIREAGAKEVHMRISSPKFLHPCYYGTDVDSEENLIATHHSEEEIASIIGADSLAFLTVDRAKHLCPPRDPDSFCCACFDGIYPTKLPEATGKMVL